MGNDVFLRWYGGNLGLGKGAGNGNSTGVNSIAIGDGSQGTGLQTVGINYTLGTQAGLSLTSGQKNFFGNFQAGLASSSATDNNLIGYKIGNAQTDATDNNGLGTQALLSNVHGSRNTAFGTNSIVFNEGNDNIGVGYFAGFNSLTSDGNVFVGNKSGYSATTGDYNISIGTGVDVVSATTSGQLNIGNLIYGSGLYQSTTQSSTPVDGRVGIGVAIPAASSILDLTSANKGFLPPRMTTTEINAISSPAAGLVVYNTTLAALCFYDGSGWRKVSHSAM